MRLTEVYIVSGIMGHLRNNSFFLLIRNERDLSRKYFLPQMNVLIFYIQPSCYKHNPSFNHGVRKH